MDLHVVSSCTERITLVAVRYDPTGIGSTNSGGPRVFLFTNQYLNRMEETLLTPFLVPVPRLNAWLMVCAGSPYPTIALTGACQ